MKRIVLQRIVRDTTTLILLFVLNSSSKLGRLRKEACRRDSDTSTGEERRIYRLSLLLSLGVDIVSYLLKARIEKPAESRC
jgi:hypothetical protein